VNRKQNKLFVYQKSNRCISDLHGCLPSLAPRLHTDLQSCPIVENINCFSRPSKVPSPPAGSRPPGSILKNGSPIHVASPPPSAPAKSEEEKEENEAEAEEGGEEVLLLQQTEEEPEKMEEEAKSPPQDVEAEDDAKEQEDSGIKEEEQEQVTDVECLEKEEEGMEEMLADVANLDEIPPPAEYAAE
jgi:hypothetical protein